MTFGTWLRKIRLQNNLSQVDIAEKIGIDQSTYCRIESGRIEAKACTVWKIAQFFGKKMDDIYPPPTLNQLQLFDS